MKDLSYVKINSVNPEKSNGNEYLILVLTD